MNQLAKVENLHEVMESVLLKGDISKLSAEERNNYYMAVCKSIGLNPLTKPLEFIVLNGKLRLYALKDCTDQLRSIHKVSVTEMTETEREGVYIVKSKVQNAEGRTDMAIGAVNIAGLKGEALANAMMKTETKSKRRATLSICGLGLLDETEIEDIPRNQVRVPSPSEAETPPETRIESSKTVEKPTEPARHQRPKLLPPQKNDTFEKWAGRYMEALDGAQSTDELAKWDSLNDEPLEKVNGGDEGLYRRITHKFAEVRERLLRASISTGPAETVVPPAEKSQRPEGYPNPAMEPDAFLNFCDKRMARINDATELQLVFENEIDPAADGMMQPDYQELQAMFKRHEQRTGG